MTILAPCEQYGPNAYPGVTGGVAPREMMLFDLEADPAESRDVANEYPDVVRRLKDLYERMLESS